MAIDKRISYINQDGYKNYIKNSDSITIPRKFKARKKATSTHLAYITKAEAAQLKKQNKGTPHKGPKGIPSYDSFDASGGYTSGTAMSAAETGSSNQRDRAEVRASNIGGPKGLAPGVTSNQAQELRDSFLQARAMGQRRSGIGGLLGALGRGALGLFGGIPGKIASGIMTAKNWAKQKGTGVLQGAQDLVARDEEGNPLYNTLEEWWNRDKIQPIKPIETIPTNQDIIGERIGEYWRQPQNNNLGVNDQVIEEEQNLYPNVGLGAAEGGRIGYAYGTRDPEEPAENIFEIMQDQNIPFSEQVEAGPTEEQIAMVIDMDGKGIDMETISSVTQLGKEAIMSILGVEMAQGGIARLL